MILAGDIGGTNTRLAFFDAPSGPLQMLDNETYSSGDFETLGEIVEQFLDSVDHAITRACFGIAGPVINGSCQTPNLPWIVDAHELEKRLSIDRLTLINDLEANARGITELDDSDFVVLHAGHPDPIGNQALISAGTGLGEAGLFFEDGRYHPFATEGGHVDFAPRNATQMEMLLHFLESDDHVSYERVLSGPGLHNIYRFLLESGRGDEPEWLQAEFQQQEHPAAVISKAAMNNRSVLCNEALEMFVSIYGAEAGNLALKTLATAGIYLGGGMAPRIIQKLQSPLFLDAFFSKGRMSHLLKDIPVKVIMNDKTALLGAARYAIDLDSASRSNSPDEVVGEQ